MRAGNDATDTRLTEIEAELAALKERVAKLEASPRPHSPRAQTSDDEIIIDSEKAEYLIGAQLLPRVGAALIVLGIILFAVLGSGRGGGANAGPILGSELAACLAFIAVGEWKRDELEGFGQVLTAIGSCGLFLSAGSAYFAYDILTIDGLTAAFVLLAFANFTYSAWRSSRTFHVFGVLGGFAAAAFAAQQHDYMVASSAYVATALAGSAAAARRHWMAMATTQWLFGLAALVPMIAADQRWESMAPTLYIGSLAAIAAYSWSHASRKEVSHGLPAAIALFLSASIGWGMQHAPIGGIHIALLSLAGLGIAISISREARIRTTLLIGSIATGGLLIPWCFDWRLASPLFVLCSVGAWLLGRVAIPRLAACFAVVELLQATWAYSYAVKDLLLGAENAILVGLALGIVFSSLALRNAKWNGAVLASFGFWLLGTRWALVLVGSAKPDLGGLSVSTLVWVAYALLLLIFGFAWRSATLRFCSFGVMLVTIVKVLCADLSSTSVSFRVGVLLALGLLMIVGGYAYVHGRRLPTV